MEFNTNNMISSAYKSAEPVVGMPATFLSYTDRSPGTVIRIISEKCIEIDDCPCEVIGGPYEYGDSMEYEYLPKEITDDSRGTLYTLRKNGDWVRKGTKLGQGGVVMLGAREKYRDPSF